MHILLIHNYYKYYGGEESYFHSLIKLLKKNGHRVTIYTKKSEDIKTIWDKIKVATGMFWNINTEKELSIIINKYKPDIAHFNNIYPIISPTSYHVCKKYNIPIVQHIHNYRFVCPKGILFRKGKMCELCVSKKFPFYSIVYGCYHNSRLASLLFSLSFFFHKIIGTFSLIDTFIFPSNFAMNYYQNKLNSFKKKSMVIPHFVMNDKNIKNIPRTRKYFLYVGRLSEEKGIIQLLELFKTLTKMNLVVIGDGPLKKLVKKYKKYTNIKIKYFVENKSIRLYMNQAYATIIPSLFYETGPIIAVESLANKTPVLVPKYGAFDDLLKRKGQASIIYYSNHNDLKNKIINFSKKAINTTVIDESFSSDYHYQKLISLYKKLLDNK